MGGYECDYKGQVDAEGRACGYGEAKNKFGAPYNGMFMNDKLHGFCKCL